MSGWSNYSGTVTSQKMSENEMGYRGSKSVACNTTAVKEQRVDGSCFVYRNTKLRCTLMDFERNYQVRILSKQIINHTFMVQESFPCIKRSFTTQLQIKVLIKGLFDPLVLVKE